MFVYQVVATKCVSDKNKKQIKKQALSQTQSKKIHLIQLVEAIRSAPNTKKKKRSPPKKSNYIR